MIKVLLVDDSTVLRGTIRDLLNGTKEIKVIGECVDGCEVIPFLEHHIPDVILMDYRMPTLNGIETTKLVKDLFPEIKVIGLSNNDDIMTRGMFFDNGAIGFISKYEVSREILVQEINFCVSIE